MCFAQLGAGFATRFITANGTQSAKPLCCSRVTGGLHQMRNGLGSHQYVIGWVHTRCLTGWVYTKCVAAPHTHTHTYTYVSRTHVHGKRHSARSMRHLFVISDVAVPVEHGTDVTLVHQATNAAAPGDAHRDAHRVECESVSVLWSPAATYKCERDPQVWVMYQV